jgi:dihydroneopterin aldolase
MGKIVIEDMEFYAFHGHYREEQIVGNRFLVDLELETNLETASNSDRKKSNLLENIGKRILDALYDQMAGIEKATLRIRKMHPPLGGPVRSVGITMNR